MNTRKTYRKAARTLKPLEEGVDYKVKGTVKGPDGDTLTEIEIDPNHPQVGLQKGYKLEKAFLTPWGGLMVQSKRDHSVPDPWERLGLKLDLTDYPWPRSTQDYVRLGHELKFLMGTIDDFRCTLPNGLSGYLLPEEEVLWLRIYISWAVKNGPQLKGGERRPVDERIMEYAIYHREVFQEQQRTGCSKYEAIEAVQKRKPQLPTELTKKYPFVRRAHSVPALEKLLSPARLKALLADWPYPKKTKENREAFKAWFKKREKMRKERGYFQPPEKTWKSYRPPETE
jgi:hypothetical protein